MKAVQRIGSLLFVLCIICSFLIPAAASYAAPSAQCAHVFKNNERCSICGIECEHDYNNGICNGCNKTCVHTWENDMCISCDVYCEHVNYTDGHCNICQWNCPHDKYENGVCAICQYECLHENHTQEQGICLRCEAPVFHDYVNGECIICNRAPVFYNDFLPDEYYSESDKQGKVETITYTCEKSSVKGVYIDKKMVIWTPCSYNENTRYNVLVLMHGGGGSCDNWVTSTFTFGKRSIKFSNIYDRIVEENNVAPFIIVSIPADSTDNQIANELRYNILPYVIENYSTWADSSDVEDIVKARDHFGIGGMSNGSQHTFNAGMRMCFDLFGNYMGLSGNGQEKRVEKTITSEDYKNLSVRCFFSGCGTNDDLIGSTSAGYKYIISCSNGRFVEGTNAWYQNVAGGHDWKVWSTEIVNALQVMF